MQGALAKGHHRVLFPQFSQPRCAEGAPVTAATSLNQGRTAVGREPRFWEDGSLFSALELWVVPVTAPRSP